MKKVVTYDSLFQSVKNKAPNFNLVTSLVPNNGSLAAIRRSLKEHPEITFALLNSQDLLRDA